MSAYAILDVDIQDPDKYQIYMKGVQQLISDAGGRYLTRGGEHQVYEGEWQPSRLVIVEFPSMEAIETFYDSPEYQELKSIRQTCSSTNLVTVAGLD